MPTCYRHPGRETYIRCQRCDRPICPDCMRDASVGFQCPSCVAEGAKSTRSGRTAYGGLWLTNASITSLGDHRRQRRRSGWRSCFTGGRASQLIDLLALRPNGGLRGRETGSRTCRRRACLRHLAVLFVDGGDYWQLVNEHVHPRLRSGTSPSTCWRCGSSVRRWSWPPAAPASWPLYLLSGMAASTLVYWASPEFQATLGASGAIFGLMGASARGRPERSAATCAACSCWICDQLRGHFPVGGGISWQGHLGGFIGGVVIAGDHRLRPPQAAHAVAGARPDGVLGARWSWRSCCARSSSSDRGSPAASSTPVHSACGELHRCYSQRCPHAVGTQTDPPELGGSAERVTPSGWRR